MRPRFADGYKRQSRTPQDLNEIADVYSGNHSVYRLPWAGNSELAMSFKRWHRQKGCSGVWPAISDTIRRDSCVPLIPFWHGRRQTEQTPGWTSCPSNQAGFSTDRFPLWIQQVAAVKIEAERQSKTVYAGPETAGCDVATSSHFSASFVYSNCSGFLQTRHAVFMANPEV